MLNIVFGSVKTNNARTSTQEFDYPSIRVEASKGVKTSRRILFNKEACDLLGLEDGSAQVLLFGFSKSDEAGKSRLFVVNTDQFANEVDEKCYKTSKNKVSYNDSSEKGKAISSKPLVEEIINFLGLDENIDQDFTVSMYQESGPDSEADLYEIALTSSLATVASSENIEIESMPIQDPEEVVVNDAPPILDEVGQFVPVDEAERKFSVEN